MIRKCLMILFVVFANCCYGQDKVSQVSSGQPKILNPYSKTPFPYDHFIFTGFQDKVGNFWFATSDGVYHYDGSIFTNYKEMDGLSIVFRNGITGDIVENIVEDRSGNIWFSTRYAAIRYDGKTFTHVEISKGSTYNFSGNNGNRGSDSNFSDEKPSISVFSDRSGNIWLFSGFDVYRFNEISGSAVKTGIGDYLKNELMRPGSVDKGGYLCGAYQDSKGNIWFTTRGANPFVQSFRLSGSRINHACVINNCKHDLHNPKDLATHNKEIGASLFTNTLWETHNGFAFSTVLEDKDGNIWFGTWNDGVYRYDARGVSLDPSGAYMRNDHHFITRFSTTDILSKSAIITIYEDKTGKIWFGTGAVSDATGNGVFCYNPSDDKMVHFTTRNGLCSGHPFSNDIISSIIEDDAGRIWFGGDAGVCYYSAQKGGGSFVNFTAKEGMDDDHVGFVIKDKTGGMWFGTWGLGLYRYSGNALTCFTKAVAH